MDKLYITGDLVYIHGSLRIISNCDGYYATYYDENESLQEVNVNVIECIPITPEILEKNRWRTQNRWYYYLDVAEGFISYIGIDFKHKSNKGHLYVEVDRNNMVEIQYCHELQHFLFGLGINYEMEVYVCCML